MLTLSKKKLPWRSMKNKFTIFIIHLLALAAFLALAGNSQAGNRRPTVVPPSTTSSVGAAISLP
jgi:hypothetical protein